MKDDLISRQAALDALADYIHNVDRVYSTGKLTHDDCMDAAHSILDELPSAQQERKKGKWIYNSPVTMKCNQCGFVIKDWDWHRFKYCPNCIADMRGESDG